MPFLPEELAVTPDLSINNLKAKIATFACDISGKDEITHQSFVVSYNNETLSPDATLSSLQIPNNGTLEISTQTNKTVLKKKKEPSRHQYEVSTHLSFFFVLSARFFLLPAKLNCDFAQPCECGELQAKAKTKKKNFKTNEIN